MHYGDCVGNRLCAELMNASSLHASRESNLLVISVIAVSGNHQNNSRVWEGGVAQSSISILFFFFFFLG